jgi:hypothetical protein
MKLRVLVLAACTSGCLAGVAWVFVAGPTSLTPFEEGFVATSVAGQVLFLVALTTSARQLTDVCHVAMVLSLFVGAAVVTNAWVLGLLLACLVAVQRRARRVVSGGARLRQIFGGGRVGAHGDGGDQVRVVAPRAGCDGHTIHRRVPINTPAHFTWLCHTCCGHSMCGR